VVSEIKWIGWGSRPHPGGATEGPLEKRDVLATVLNLRGGERGGEGVPNPMEKFAPLLKGGSLGTTKKKRGNRQMADRGTTFLEGGVGRLKNSRVSGVLVMQVARLKRGVRFSPAE